ncbi:MAG TPA: PKD domain-containing protein, partial [Solirubrobacteraceae bacterium]|nr:PKD domain-containing protein [Solirubrobacteraceae bacterium]
ELSQPGGSNFGDAFGDGVAVAGGTALVSDPFRQAVSAAGDGAVYVFTGAGTTWTPRATLTTGVQFDYFGLSIALSSSGDTALIGAPTATSDPLGTGAGTGSAYVFTGSGSNWVQQQKLTASDGAVGDTLGTAIALSASGDDALVGAPTHKVGSASQQGAAYVFTRTGAAWSQQQELTASDGTVGDKLGSSLALSGDGTTAVLGQPRLGSFRGGAYSFVRTGSGWIDEGPLLASDAAANDELGSGVGLDSSGAVALLGAQNKGVVYAFGLSGGPPRIIASGAVSSHSTSIDVAATIIPEGLATHYHVEWGSTTAYGQSGPELPQSAALTGFAPVDVLAELTGLTGSTTYHWRIVAANADGTVYGPDHADTTKPLDWIPHETVPPRGHTSVPVPVSSVGSIAGSAPVATYGWDFSGNGTFGLVCPAGMPLAYHTYARPGTYTVALKITTVTGQTSVAKQQITVVGGGGTVIGGPPPNNSGGACASVVNGASCVRIVDWGLIHAEIDDGGCFDVSKPLRATPVTNCVVCPVAARASSPQEAYVGSDWWARFDRANGMVYSTLHPVTMNGLTFTPQDVGQKVGGVDANRFVIDQADSYVFAPDADVTIAHSSLQVGRHEAIDKIFPTVAPSILGVTAGVHRHPAIARTAAASSGFDNPCDDPDITQAPLLAQIGNNLPHAVGIDGFGIAGAIDVHVVNGEAVMCANATLPLFSSGPPGFRPLTVHATLISDSVGGLHLDNLHATLDDGYLGLVHFSHLEFSYSRADARWEAAATMDILPGFTVAIDMAFETGAFRHGAIGVDFPDPGFPVADSGVYITHIDGSVDNPAGGPFAVTGHVKLGAQPNLPGIGYLLTIDGGMGITFGDTPTVEVAGDAQLLGVTLANGDVKVSGDGSFSVSAHIDQRLFGVIGVVSDFSGAYWPRLNFNVEASSTLSVLDLISIGGNFLVSSRGVAGCVALKSGPFHLHVGAGVTYSPFDVNLMFSSCDVGPWRVSHARDATARAAADGVLVSPGMSYEVIGVDGTSAPPAVTVTGPGGARVSAPAIGHTLTSDYLVAHDPAGKTTFVVIRAPRAGLWTVTPASGSSAISRVRSAASLPDPAVTATVTGTGRERTLSYRIRRIPGQAVRFIETGRGAFGVVGAARGTRGTLRFAAADGPGGIRNVIALVDENSIPRARIVVAHY